MQKLEDVIKEQYGDNNEAGRQTGTSYIQIGRWISYGCKVDIKGTIWKPQGNLYKNRDSVPAIKDNSGWISVEDRLPDDATWVLVYAQFPDLESRVVTMAFFEGANDEGEIFWLCHNDTKKLSEWEGVNYWMPLPEPPKELSK